MELNEIEYFLALASYGNISRAAENLYISQSALSQFLTKAESKIGTKLFNRDHTGLTLTDAGQIYYEAALRIEKIQRQALQSIDYTTRMNHGKIRVGVIGPRSIENIVKITPHIKKAFPDKDIEIKQGNVSRLCKELDERTIDFAFMALGSVSSNFSHIPISSEELVLAVSRQKADGDPDMPPVIHDEPVDIRDFQDINFILNTAPAELRNVTDMYFNKIGFLPTVFAYVDDFLLALEVLNNYPCAYVISTGYIHKLKNCDVYRLSDTPLYKLGMVYRKDSRNGKLINKIVEIITSLDLKY